VANYKNSKVQGDDDKKREKDKTDGIVNGNNYNIGN
jgi:hypothetical protein